MKVVLDTNVLLSGLINPGGTPGRIISAWDDHGFTVVLSWSQVQEIARVLAYPKIRRILRWSDMRIEEFTRQLLLRSEVVDVAQVSVEVPADPGDVAILAALIASRADLLITGDRDLLVLRDRYAIETPAEFVRRL